MGKTGHVIVVLLLLWGVSSAAGQSIAVEPPVLASNGRTFPTVLFQPQETLQLRWNRSVAGLKLKIGNVPGEFRSISLDAGDRKELSFTPASAGLPVGVYYAILTNAAADRFADIRKEARSPDIHDSAMFTFAVESPIATAIIRPRGEVDTSTPIFEWEAIPGVQAYALVVSSTPFDIRTDPETNESVVEGINIVWALITTETTAVYAQSDLGSPFPQFPAPPLIPGQEYNYTVLNGYSKTDPAFLSDVFGSVVAFTYASDTRLDAPDLSAPAPNISLFGDETIRFEWEPVDNATSYTFGLFERRREDGSVGDFQVFSTSTPATTIDVSARTLLRRGTYTWYVIPSDASGAGSVSERRTFHYFVPMGTFTFITRSSVDDAGIIGVRIGIRSTEGGYSPINPFINNTSVSFSDSLVVGSYAFDASKEGYADTTVVAVINRDQRTVVNIPMRPLPASVSGIVLEPDDRPVENAIVTLATATRQVEAITGADGRFSRSLSPGTYAVTARRAGYSSSAAQSITVGSDDYLTLDAPLVIERSGGQVSGRVLSESGQPVQLAVVRATLNGTVQEVTTNGSGAFSLFLASGTWSLTTRKDGFVSPQPTTVTLARGDNLQQVNLVLTERAGRISGTVFGTVFTNGQPERRAVSGAIIEAVPLAGNVIRAAADGAGIFSMDLGAGSWRLRALSTAHLPSDPLDVVLGLGDAIDGAVFDLIAPSASVSGTVRTPSGTRIAGAVVRLGTLGSVITTADGAFRIPAGPGSFVLTATAADHSQAAPQTIDLSAGTDLQGIDVLMVPGAARLTGRVRASGVPVPRSRVSGTTSSGALDLETDDDGAFTAWVAPGKWTLGASAIGHRSAGTVEVTVLAGQQRDGLQLELVRHVAFIQGFVSASTGPVRAAQIRISRQDGTGTAQTGLSRSDGGFALAVSPDAAYSVRVSASGFIPKTLSTGRLTSGEIVVLEAALSVRTAGISGRILDSAGRPLRGALVRAERDGSDPVQAESAIDGRYDLALSAGAWLVAVAKPGYGSQDRSINLAIGQVLQDVDFGLASAFGSLLVTAIDASDAPVSGVLLRLAGPAGARSFITGLDGKANISGLAAGTYELSASADGYDPPAATSVVIEPSGATSTTIRLVARPGSIAARVKDASGAPVQGAVLRVESAGQTFSSVSNAEGSVEQTRLPLGVLQWTVTHTAHGFVGPNAAELSSAQPSIDLGDIVLGARTAGITGRITDDAGGPVAAATIVVAGENGSSTTQSAPDGAYTITGMVAGDYAIEASKTGHVRASAPVALQAGTVVTADLTLNRALGRLTGSVVDDAGNALPFAVRVTASTGTAVHTTGTDPEGVFSLDGLEPGRTYAVRTDIARIGYGNAETSFDFPSGQTTAGPLVLTVPVRTALISGTVGTDRASIRIVASTGGATQQVVTSSTDATYRARYLPAGTWIVAPEKEGFSFTPPTRTVTVEIGGTASADFAAASSVGSIRAVVQNAVRQPQPGVQVSLTSEDGLVARSVGTVADGSALFSGLPLGRTYVIRPIAPGFSSQPVVASISLSSPVLQSITFTLVEANGRISGRVVDAGGALVADARVTAIHTETAAVFRSVAADGTYLLTKLPAGTFSITATADGFRGDPVTVALAEGAASTAPDLVVLPVTVRLHGRVVYRNVGLAGVRVTATAGTALETRTDVTGAYRFPRAPITGEPADTTVYLIQAETSGGSQSRVVRIAGSAIGSLVVVPDFLVPSGRISIRVTDGMDPLPGATVDIAGAGGVSLGGVTDGSGQFRTTETLAADEYTLAVSRDPYLTPDLVAHRVRLVTDTSTVSVPVALPYRHDPPEVIAIGVDVPIRVTMRALYDPALAQARVHWRQTVGGAYQSVALARRDSTFVGVIPAVSGPAEVQYFVTVDEGGQAFVSPVVSRTPQQPGRLSLVRIEPALDGTLIRTGERYALSLQIRDGLGTSLRDRFVGAGAPGTVVWTASSTEVELEPNGSDPTRLRLRSARSESFNLRARVLLDGIEQLVNARVTSSDAVPSAIVLSAPSARIDNRSAGIQFSHQAATPDGLPLLLGDGLSWSLTPVGAGTIDDTGFFVPTNPQFIGPVTVRARDAKTGRIGTVLLTIFARVDGPVTLTDLAGTVIELPAGAFPVSADVSLGQPVLAGPKRSVIPSGATNRHTVGDHLIRFTVRSDRAQVGDSLAAPARLSREADRSIALHVGDPTLGFFDTSTLVWTLLETELVGDTRIATVHRLSEFGELIENESLGIRHAVVLPSPFSPDIAPLKIGYFLTTDDPPAVVTVRIFNVRGERVRTLVDRETQFPGRFGSRSSPREITWDGLTDAGTRARNGRYLIEIKATDQSGTTTELLQVVLVK